MSLPTQVPIPPVELATRVGPGPSGDPIQAYLQEGADVRARIERFLPDDWAWAGKRTLDFGCGSARVLRHFLDEADGAEFWGCDIHAPSIAWVEEHLVPPLHVLQNAYAPPLAVGDGSFDLVYATSVFTHIDVHWSAWLLEVHRILKPGGRFISSFLGEGMWEGLIAQPYVEDEVGMTARRHWTAEDVWVFHSEWWLREHWGRLFEVEEVRRPPRAADGSPQVTHSYISLTRRDVALDAEALERIDPAEPRELVALQTNVRLLRQELALAAAIAEAPSAWRRRGTAVEAALHQARLGPVARGARAARDRARALRPR